MTQSINFHRAAAYKQIVRSVLETGSLNEALLPSTWRLAEANQLLLALWRFISQKEEPDHVWAEKISRLTQLEAETADVVHDILPQFTRKGLLFLTIKSFLPFPYVDSNLDLVTAIPDRQAEYLKLARQLGYRRYCNFADVREPMKQTFQTPGIRLRLHFHTAISWNGIIYLPFAQLWRRRRLWKTLGGHVWIPSAEDELLIMAAHAFFENKMVSLHEILYWHLLVKTNLDWSYIVNSAQNNGWYCGLVQFISIASQLSELLDIPIELPISIPDTPIHTSIWLPYIFPLTQNWVVTTSKLLADLHKGLWRKLPRQLFSYLLVDYFWMYRKAYFKRRKVKAVCS